MRDYFPKNVDILKSDFCWSGCPKDAQMPCCLDYDVEVVCARETSFAYILHSACLHHMSCEQGAAAAAGRGGRPSSTQPAPGSSRTQVNLPHTIRRFISYQSAVTVTHFPARYIPFE